MRSKRISTCLPAALAVVLSAGALPATAQGTGPERFAPGVLDLDDRDEYGPVFTANGDEVFLTIRRDRSGREFLARAVRSGTSWTDAHALSFSGSGIDKEPYLSLDGSRLFFASRRAVPSGAQLGFEIWQSTKVDREWTEPTHLAAIGGPGDENYPAVAANGNLYFGSDRIDGRGRIFVARWTGSSFEVPEPLMAGDSPMAGADPYVDPAERFIIHSSTRSGGLGEGDLYLTLREGDGWGSSTHLGPIINSTDYEYTPFISADGEFLYFSRGWGEMWRIRVAEVPELERAMGRNDQ